jgi:hypothetical protein
VLVAVVVVKTGLALEVMLVEQAVLAVEETVQLVH